MTNSTLVFRREGLPTLGHGGVPAMNLRATRKHQEEPKQDGSRHAAHPLSDMRLTGKIVA